jgi:hypothetical protein
LIEQCRSIGAGLRGGITHGMRIILDECLHAGEDACYMLSFGEQKATPAAKREP